MSTNDPFGSPPVPGGAQSPPPVFAPRPATDAWGHEVGEDAGHRLDATGHVPHEHDPVARMIGEPMPYVPRTRGQQLAIRLLLTVVVLAVLGVAAWYLITQQHIFD